MKLSNDIKYVINAKNEYHNLIYSLKDDNPYLDISVISPSLLYEKLNFSISDGAISYLLKKEKDDYLMVKSKLKILNIVDIGKNSELNELYKELSNNGFIEKDELFKIEINQLNVLVLEEKENYELNSFLNRNNIKYNHISLSDLGIKTKQEEFNPLCFDSKLLQFMYIFSSIRKQIIVDKVDPNKISILSSDESDFYYLKLCSDLFNIDVDLISSSPLRSDEEVSMFISNSFENKSFDLSSIKNEYLINIFNKYKLNELNDFSFAYLNLLEIIQEYKINISHKSGIKVINNFNITDDYIYVTNFQFDVFYKNYQNTSSFSEEELFSFGLNPSYTKTSLDSIFKWNYLIYSNIVHLSRISSSSSEKKYDSNYIEEKGINKYQKADFNYNGLYTTSSNEIISSILKDNNACSSDLVYKSYSNKYNKIPLSIYKKEFNENNPANASLLKSYFSCHYKYYIENILKPFNDNPSDNTTAIFGTLLHHIFESTYNDFKGLISEIDFDTIYNNALEETKKSFQIDEYTNTLFNLSKKYIEVSYKAALQHKFYNPNIKQSSDEIEYKFKFNLDKTPYYLKGSIDKIVRVNSSSQHYYVIIDNKTSQYDTFDYQLVPFGGSLQLPIYYLALENNPTFSKLLFAGFFIDFIFSKKIIKKDILELKNYYSRLTGLYLYSIDFVNSFDVNSLSSKKDKIIGKNTSDNYIDVRNSFSGNDSITKDTFYTFTDLINDSKKAIIESINNIQNNDFSIAPVTKDNPDYAPCKYCLYKNICYRRFDDIVVLKEKIKKKFGTSDDSSNEEEEKYGN